MARQYVQNLNKVLNDGYENKLDTRKEWMTQMRLDEYVGWKNAVRTNRKRYNTGKHS